ncbi:MAG: hypothetical protein K9J17_00450 [Flavobacteriales bacterium]|nr:hypothetical protein [Flavobacteriales bacterium]
MKRFAFIFLVVLISPEKYFQDNMVVRLIPGVLTIGLVLLNMGHRKVRNIKYSTPGILLLTMAMLVIGVIRDNSPDKSWLFNTFEVLVYISLAVGFVQTAKRHLYNPSPANCHRFLVWSIYIPIFLLLVINLLGFAVGLKSESAEGMDIGKAVMLSSIGIDIDRASFPFAPSFNTYGAIVGLLLLISLFMLEYFNRYRILMLMGIGVSITTLFVLDTRSAMLYPFLIYGGFKFWGKRGEWFGGSKLVPVIMLLGAPTLLLILTILTQIPEASFIARTSSDLQSANSRSIIWFISMKEFLDFKLVHLFGYGQFGHYASGASFEWSGWFSEWGDNAALVTPHNTFFSVLFDFGYFGLVVLVTLQYRLIHWLKVASGSYYGLSTLILAVLVYWNLIGVTETFFGFYSAHKIRILTLLFFLAHFLSINAKRKNSYA